MGCTLFFLIFARKHRLWVLVTEAVLTSTHNLCVEQKYENYQSFFLSDYFFFSFLEVKFSIYLNRRVFIMFENSFLTLCLNCCVSAKQCRS